jgi:uncharacterized protein (TIGR00251 family)
MGKLRVRVQPGAKRDEVLGFQEGVLRIKLAAPPIEGRANKALVAILAGLLKVPKQQVIVVAGSSARDKLIEVTGMASDEIVGRLKGRLPDNG